MNKQSHSQLELFQPSGVFSTKAEGSANAFVMFISTYEKAILVIIGFIVTGAIAFCVGVEKGKRTAGLSSVVTPPAAVRSAPQPVSAPARMTSVPAQPPSPVQPVVTAQKAAPVKPAEAKPALTKEIVGYAIQVATYQNKSSAEKEAQSLRKKGFNALVVKKGNYSVVCIGSFSNKEKAKSTLTEIKKSYRDSYVRRL